MPPLLLMDSHYSHKFNWYFLDLMKDSNITVLAIPPHTSHHLQPLDKTPFKSLEDAWDCQLRMYNRERGGKKLPKSDFFSVFNVAWWRGMTSKAILAGWRVAGLWPLDPKRIKAYKMVPSTVTDACKQTNRFV